MATMLGCCNAGGGAGFGPKPLDDVRAAERAEGQQLERDDAVQVDLPGLIDDAHPALPNLLQQLVVAKPPMFGF